VVRGGKGELSQQQPREGALTPIDETKGGKEREVKLTNISHVGKGKGVNSSQVDST